MKKGFTEAVRVVREIDVEENMGRRQLKGRGSVEFEGGNVGTTSLNSFFNLTFNHVNHRI